MSEPLASYSFLPWLRRGVGADISRVDGGGTAEPRHALPIAVRFNSDDAKTGTLKLELFGPGEVRSFDSRAVIRTWPRVGVMDAEPNFFPAIEFDQADLPWRYTPARATAGDRLTPWITLIVLADDEVESLTPPQGQLFGRVTVKDASVLPKHSQLWAWAHVQVTGETMVSEAKAAELLASDGHRVIARMLAPRRMKPRVSYTAFVVPSFQRGVAAGMGLDPDTTVDGLEPAWTDTTNGALSLPIYYQWRFGTGPAGDFESLARVIKKFATPPTVGMRDMDVSAPSPGAPPAHDAPLGMQGMLRGLTTPSTGWTGPARSTWITWLAALLNRPADRLLTTGEPRTVTPPLYGQWHAATDRCTAGAPNPRPVWFQDANVDPRYRVAAALGTQVVQTSQEALMASAWDQVERIRQLNEELRQAQLARELAAQVAKRHVMVASDETVLMLTAPLHARVKASPRTIRAVLADSPVPRGAFDGAFRRITRPLGPLARRQPRDPASTRPGLLQRLNEGLSAAPVPPAPGKMATPARSGTGLAPPGTTQSTVARRRRRYRLLRILAIMLGILVPVFLLLGVWAVAAVLAILAAIAFVLSRADARATEDLAKRVAFRDGLLTGETVRATPPAAGFVPVEGTAAGAPAPAGVEATPEVVAAVQESLARVMDRIAPPSTPGRVLHRVDMTVLRDKLEKALDPRRTVAAAFDGRYTLTEVQWQPDDPIEPIMAAPEFPQPMYAELKKISVDWLLPGYSQIPANVATLLQSNGSMIDAYMLGLNHEMARELLWREYPTDQRGSYFRQFWDVAGFVPAPGQPADPEALKDITPLHTWSKTSALGTHTPRPPMPAGDYLVLLVRGDLLRRYPNTTVYAARARWTEGNLREIQDPGPDATDAEIAAIQEWPMFSGVLEPDGTFFGFRLTVAEAKGSTDTSGDPGWYFVLQEHSSEPRFGLDEADPSALGAAVAGANWNNLSWGSLVSSQTALDTITCIDLDAQLPDTMLVTDPVTKRWHADQGTGEQGSRSSDIAYITLQRPMRVGIHGADMIP